MKNSLRKIISVVICAMLIFSFSATALADTVEGSGTYASPYLIKTAADLNVINEKIAAGENCDGIFIRLENDITVNSAFTPIGTKETPFGGNFDGNGKTVSGISVSGDYAGFFAFCKGAVITDLTVNGSFSADNYAGAIVAYAENTVIDNCTGSASVTAYNYAGGIAGYIASGTIKDCKTSGSAVAVCYTEYCGGIAGFTGASVTSCVNNAYILGTATTGGIAGASEGSIVLCSNNVNLEASGINLGGIAGLTEGSIKYSENTGRLTANGNVGGIAGVGYNAEISECINSGEITSTGNFAGGIAGYLTSSNITDCLSTASIYCTAGFSGGIFGNAQKSEIADCIFTSSVTTSDSTGGAIGALSNSKVSGCYYSSANSSTALYTGKATDTKGLSASEMADKESFTALDFNNTWEINELHAGYPLLKNIPYHTLSVISEEKASCDKNGHTEGICNICNETVIIETPAYGHSYKIVSSKLPTCTVAGYTDRLCTVCGDTDSENIPANGHTDADGNEICDTCSASLKNDEPQQTEKSFFEKIADFFRALIEWLGNIFKA